MSALDFEICRSSRRVCLPLGDVIFCEKHLGRKLPEIKLYKEWFKDGDFCVGTEFEDPQGHVVGITTIDRMKMYNCPNREGKLLIKEEIEEPKYE
jgi:hypothetical protein